MGAEEHYLDAVEAYDEGDLEAAYASANLLSKKTHSM